MINISQLHRHGMTGEEQIANPVELNHINDVWNNKVEKAKKKKKKKKNTKEKIRVLTDGGDSITNWAGLPEDIIMCILPMLPAVSLLRFRCVCKSWYNLFKTANFAKLQLDYSNSLKNHNDGILIEFDECICYLDYDSLSSDSSTLYDKLVHIAYPEEHQKEEILGSCNGLVCYRSYQDDIIIWNPLTGDHKKLPTPPGKLRHAIQNSLCSFGFWYDSKTEDYKLVSVADLVCLVLGSNVYSLKTNSWKTIMYTPYKKRHFKNLLFFQGGFHWVKDEFSGPKEMSCFDTANETWKHIRLPQHFRQKFKTAQACLLGGRLCVIAKDAGICEIWTMKEYGVAESWTKIFTNYKVKHLSPSVKNKMQYSRLQRLEYLKLTFKNVAISVNHVGTSTYLYDPHHEGFRLLKIDGILPGHKTWGFCGSLVSPN